MSVCFSWLYEGDQVGLGLHYFILDMLPERHCFSLVVVFTTSLQMELKLSEMILSYGLTDD